jgi:hypothetical protein
LLLFEKKEHKNELLIASSLARMGTKVSPAIYGNTSWLCQEPKARVFNSPLNMNHDLNNKF